MSTMSEQQDTQTTSHTHTCRDCGVGYECEGRLSADEQCAIFDGLCDECSAAEAER